MDLITTMKDKPPFSWEAARPFVAAEMEAQSVTRAGLAARAGLPLGTVYEAFRDDARRIYADTLDRILSAIGRDMVWLSGRMSPPAKRKKTKCPTRPR